MQLITIKIMSYQIFPVTTGTKLDYLNTFTHYLLENTYTTLFVYSIASLALALVILFLNAIITRCVANSGIDLEKSSSYECGFEPYGNSKIVFSFQYYIVAILFLIFDLELLFIFP
jgi:NADH:ubiquinone oxidoreductase subunit 3 (subunit A)